MPLVLALSGCSIESKPADKPVSTSKTTLAPKMKLEPVAAPDSDLDKVVIDQLQKAGSNLTKPHAIDFYLYFPDKPVALEAAAKMAKAGFQVKFGKAAKGDKWLCIARKSLVPELPAIQEIGRNLTEMATSLKGEYDGWEAGVEK